MANASGLTRQRLGRIKPYRVALAAGLLLNLVWPLASASAATNPNAGEGLEISPPVIELAADPGQTVVTNIRIRNVTKDNLLATPKADDFGAKGENGEPQILLDETGATRYSLKFWVQPMPTLLLVPQEIKTATVKIVIPKDAEPGGHFGVVRFTAHPAGLESNGVALSASIGTLILLKVNGPTTEQMSLVQMYVSRNSLPGSLFETGPLTFSERIKNSGTVHLQPTGKLTVKDMFGKQVSSFKVNDPPRNVLPDSIRRFDQNWSKRWLIGRYTASLDLTYGTTNGVLKGSTSFWVIPYKLILLALVLLVVLFFGLRLLIRRYNRYIIAQSRQHHRKK